MNNDNDYDDGVGKAALPFSDMDGWMDGFLWGGGRCRGEGNTFLVEICRIRVMVFVGFVGLFVLSYEYVAC